MSPRRRRWPAVVGALASCALLSGCFGSGGSGSSEPTAGHHTRHHTKSTEPTGPTEPTTPSGSSSSSSPANAAVLRFSPPSDGQHSHDCLTLHPGDDPAEFLYYPVVVTTGKPAHIDGITTEHTDGVTVAGAWIAPAPTVPTTGTPLPGWPPPKIFTSSSSVEWSKRVPAAGASLDPSAGWYNIFLRIQVDPTPGDSSMSGVQISYHDAAGSHTATWVDHVKFSMSC